MLTNQLDIGSISEPTEKRAWHHSSSESHSIFGNFNPTSVSARYGIHGSNRSIWSNVDTQLGRCHWQTRKKVSVSYEVRLWRSTAGWCQAPDSWCIITTSYKWYRWFPHQRWDRRDGRQHTCTGETHQIPSIQSKRDSITDKWTTGTDSSWVQKCKRRKQLLRKYSTDRGNTREVF